MPIPNPGEGRTEFVDRCIPIVLEDGTATDGDEAVAICHSLYDQAQSEATMSDKRTDKQDIDYKSLPGFETKTIPTFVKNVDEAQGIVEHIISVFGIVDDGRDVVMPGSFTKSIVEHGGRVRVLDQHNYESSLNVVGKPLNLREIGRDELPPEVTTRYPDATGGLLATTQYAIKTDNGRNMFELVAGKFLPETSIGYDAMDSEPETRTINGEDVTVRLLRAIRLWEYSNVIWGMNPATTTVSAKSADSEDKTVSGATDLPIADRDRAWDAAAAIQGMRRVTDSAEEPSAQYRNGFFWFDGEAPELYTSYKFPFADDIGGELAAVPRAIFAGGARLDGSDIPDADKDRIRSRMSRYYARMREKFDDENIVPPWEKAADPPAEVKIGRAISAARMTRIRGAIAKAQDVLDDLAAMLAEVDPSDDSDNQKAAVIGAGPDVEPPTPETADDSDANGAGPGVEPPTSEADMLRIEFLKLKTRTYDTLEVTE